MNKTANRKKKKKESEKREKERAKKRESFKEEKKQNKSFRERYSELEEKRKKKSVVANMYTITKESTNSSSFCFSILPMYPFPVTSRKALFGSALTNG